MTSSKNKSVKESEFQVDCVSTYYGKSPKYNLPHEIGCFSTDAKKTYCNDGHQMKYLSMPNKHTDLDMDLNEGFDKHIHRYEHIDNSFKHTTILKWILFHQDLIREHFVDPSSASSKLDFVCSRGLLTDVCATIYQNMDDWMIYATKFNSVIYLCDIQTYRKTTREQFATEKQIRMTTWGFKFEQFMVSDTMSSKPNTSVPVNENEKYFAVLKGKLGHHRLLFQAEMDGVDPEQLVALGSDQTSPLRYVELKTSRIITSNKQKREFSYKLLKWYLQSHFGGVPKIICGFRNDEGVVQELGIFKVKDIPKLAKDYWSADACLNFCSQFLDHVKQRVVKHEAVYKFYWKPGSDAITCEELNIESTFLPKWYTSSVRII